MRIKSVIFRGSHKVGPEDRRSSFADGVRGITLALHEPFVIVRYDPVKDDSVRKGEPQEKGVPLLDVDEVLFYPEAAKK